MVASDAPADCLLLCRHPNTRPALPRLAGEIAAAGCPRIKHTSCARGHLLPGNKESFPLFWETLAAPLPAQGLACLLVGAAHRCHVLTSQEEEGKVILEEKNRVESHCPSLGCNRCRDGCSAVAGCSGEPPDPKGGPRVTELRASAVCHQLPSAIAQTLPFGGETPNIMGRGKKKPKVVKCEEAEQSPLREPRDADLQGQRQANRTARMPRSTSCLWKTAPRGARGSSIPAIPLFWPDQCSACCWRSAKASQGVRRPQVRGSINSSRAGRAPREP